MTPGTTPPETGPQPDAPTPVGLDRVGIVAIGRNEGERLKKCLTSAPVGIGCVVYVDSGSTDGSQAFAEGVGAIVVELDRSIPFTAGRARSEGVEALKTAHPGIAFVQFVDGDCEIRETWIPKGLEAMGSLPRVAVVSGRRRERHPDATIYNTLIDLEWDTPVGEAEACHGDALIRLSAYDEAGGFRHDLIAGEEPELSLRLRRKGWKLIRIDEEMTLHDADMHRFGQWWKRSVRAGYAMAEGVYLYGKDKEQYNVKRALRVFVWVAVIPFIALVAGLLFWPLALVVLAFYPLQFARFAWRGRKLGARVACAHAASMVLSKFSGAQGALTFCWRKLRGGKVALIEYKGAESPKDDDKEPGVEHAA